MTFKATKLLLCSLAVLIAMGVGADAQQPPLVVRADGGQLQGVNDDGVVAYKGIPFAAPPVGDLRWRPPQPVAPPWTGVRQAAEFGANCMQGRFGPPPAPGANAAPAPSENCLFLNVWRPASAASGAKLPVMVWIHGGGDLRVLALWHLLVWFRLLPCGFANRDLREQLAVLTGQSPNMITQGRMTYDLRRLRLHGMIERIPKTHRYRVTDFGLRAALYFTRVHARLYRPGVAQILPHAPPLSYGIQRAFQKLEGEIDQQVREARLVA